MEPQPKPSLVSVTAFEASAFHASNRYLRSGDNLHLSSAAIIAWYCLLLSIITPVFCCLLWCWYQRFRSHRRALMALNREHQLDRMSRIEANIHAFSEAEKKKRMRMIRSMLKGQVKKINASDIQKTKGKNKPEQPLDDNVSDEGYSCSICLEDFRIGERVAQSVCRHVFHEACIVLWLGAKEHAFCPYCRRPFLCLPARSAQTSVASHDQLSTAMDDVDSTRPECSVVAAFDDRGIEDSLPVVIEDVSGILMSEGDTVSAGEKDGQ